MAWPTRIWSRWRNERAPTVYALYHEARHRHHARQTSLGPALAVFSTFDQARNYGLCQGLVGYLPEPLTASTIVERFDEFRRQEVYGFLLDLSLDGQHLALHSWGDPNAGRLSRTLRQAVRRGQRQQRSALRRARRRERRSVSPWQYRVAMELYRRYRFQEAARYFELAAALDGQQAGRALVELGDIQRLQRKFGAAEATYRRALDRFGRAKRLDAARALAGIGHCRLHRGEATAAVAAFEDAFTRSRDQAAIGLMLVRLLVRLRRYEQAGRRLRELQDEHPNDPEVLNEVAGWLTQAKSYAAAHIVRRKIARLNPQDTDNLLRLAELCVPLANVHDGFEAYARAIARRPEPHVVLRFHWFCVRLGVRALHAGKSAEAVRCFRTLTRAHANWPTAQLGLRLALESLNDAQNVVIDEHGVGPAVTGDLERETLEAQSLARRLGCSPNAGVYDVTVDALLDDFRRYIHEAELAAELEHLLFEDAHGPYGSLAGDDEPSGSAEEEA